MFIKNNHKLCIKTTDVNSYFLGQVLHLLHQVNAGSPQTSGFVEFIILNHKKADIGNVHSDFVQACNKFKYKLLNNF